MKNPFLIIWLLLSASMAARAQRVISYQVLPARPTTTDNVRLVLAVQYANCGFFAGTYSYRFSNDTLSIRGCYGGGGFAIGCIRYDTVRLGRLPAGNYTVASTSHIVVTDCATAPLRAGLPNASGAFTVGALLATRQAAGSGTLFPTFLPVTAATIWLANAAPLSQVSVFDVAGREQLRFEAPALVRQPNGIELSLPNGLPGLYFLRATTLAGQVNTYRFVRQ